MRRGGIIGDLLNTRVDDFRGDALVDEFVGDAIRRNAGGELRFRHGVHSCSFLQYVRWIRPGGIEM